MIKYITVDSDGKIVMTKEEFEECLADKWEEGYRIGKSEYDSSQWWKNVR